MCDFQCEEFLVENTIDVPDEICSLEPSSECRNVTTRSSIIHSLLITIDPTHYQFSIPQLVPEEVCRDVPKDLCQTVFLNPKTVKVINYSFIVKSEITRHCFNRLLILSNTARIVRVMRSMKGSIL